MTAATDTTATADDTAVVATFDGRNIEELIGFVEEEYPCVYCGVNGTLYAGTDGLAFLGKFFLFDKKIFFKWLDVKVEQTDQGVAIQTRDELSTIHEFLGIQKPERCWSALVSLHNQAVLDRSRSPADGGGVTMSVPPRRLAATGNRRKLRRMTSDPQKLAPAINELFAPEEQQAPQKQEMGNRSSRIMLNKSTKDAISAAALSLRDDIGGDGKQQRRASLIHKPGDNNLDASSSAAANVSGQVGVVEISPTSEIEAIVGKVQGEHMCFYNGQKGTLYAGSTALYFAGQRFLFPARLTIQSSHIRQVKMIKGKPKSDIDDDDHPPESLKSVVEQLMEQGIVILTHENISHTFLGMENPDQVWASLVALRKHVGTGPNSPRPFGMRRMNSDPNLQSGVRFELPQLEGGKAAGKATAAAEGGAAKPGEQQQELAPPVLTDEELKEAWSKVTDKKNRFTTCVVKECELGCSLDRFFKTYIADDAEFSIGRHMEATGDKDMKSTPWKPVRQDDGKLVRRRVLRFIHPVNAPMAPPEAKARKEQTYQRFGDLGFTVETKTFVDDVPMTDCFFVKDRLLVEAVEGEDNKVMMTMEFELEFVKSTMFRGIITKTSTSQVTTGCQELRDYIVGSLGEEVVQPTKNEAGEHPVEKEIIAMEEPLLPAGLTMTSLTHLMLLFVILMQLWILLELYSMKFAIHKLEITSAQPHKPVYYQ